MSVVRKSRATSRIHDIFYRNSDTMQRPLTFRGERIKPLCLLDYIFRVDICPGLDSIVSLFDSF